MKWGAIIQLPPVDKREYDYPTIITANLDLNQLMRITFDAGQRFEAIDMLSSWAIYAPKAGILDYGPLHATKSAVEKSLPWGVWGCELTKSYLHANGYSNLTQAFEDMMREMLNRNIHQVSKPVQRIKGKRRA